VQQMYAVIGKLTGAKWATNQSNNIAKVRSHMGVNTTTDENGNPIDTPAINSKKTEQDSMVSKITETQKQKLSIDINDNSNGKASFKTDSNLIPIKMTSTMLGV